MGGCGQTNMQAGGQAGRQVSRTVPIVVPDGSDFVFSTLLSCCGLELQGLQQKAEHAVACISNVGHPLSQQLPPNVQHLPTVDMVNAIVLHDVLLASRPCTIFSEAAAYANKLT